MISQIQDFLQHFKLLNYTRKGKQTHSGQRSGKLKAQYECNELKGAWGEKNKAALAHTRFFRTAACSNAMEMLFPYND